MLLVTPSPARPVNNIKDDWFRLTLYSEEKKETKRINLLKYFFFADIPASYYIMNNLSSKSVLKASGEVFSFSENILISIIPGSLEFQF